MSDIIIRPSGIIYYKNEDGIFQRLGEPVEIPEISASDIDEEVPHIRLTANDEFSVTLNLKRKDKYIWGKIFRMQRYQVTEWIFPKKKKRGTKRRAKKARNAGRNWR